MAKKTKEQIDKEVEEQIALLLQGYDPNLVADVSKEDLILPDDTGLTPYDIDRQAEKNNLKKYLNAEALEFVPPDGQDVSGAQPPKIDDYAPFVPAVPAAKPFPKKTLDEMVDEAMNSNIFNVRNLYDHKNREGGTSDVARVLKDIPGFVPGFSTLPPFKGQEKDTRPIGLYSGLSEPGKRIMEFKPEGPSYYPYRNELPEDKPEAPKKEDPVEKKIKEVTNELNKEEAVETAKIQADYKALARKQDALWQYAVYRAANGDTSLFDKLVGDAEARKQKRMDQEFQAAENEKNRQSQERQTANTKNEEKLAAFNSAKTKAERALQDLNDINDDVRAKWKTGNDKNAAEDALMLRKAYRAYQYALDDAEAAARKIKETYDSNGIFAKTTGDLGINLDAMKKLDFNGLYTGERNIPYTATMASAKVNSKEVSDALNSGDPNKAREVAAMLGDELERFNTNANPAMSLEEIQRIQNLFKDKIDQLNGVKAPTNNQKRHKENETELDSAKLDYADLQTAIGKLYNDPKYQKNGKQDMDAIDAEAKKLVKTYSKNHPSYPAAYTRDKGLIAPKWGN